MAPLVLTHGCSLSNLPLFVAAGAGIFAAEGIDVDVQRYDEMSATGDALSSGVAELGTAAFTQPLIDAGRTNPPRLVAGSGLMGIALLAQPELEKVTDLVGLTIGTFPGDPLEVLLHDVLVAGGLGPGDVVIRAFDRIEDAVEAFDDRAIAAVTLAEPHANRLRGRGARELSDGRELWGDPFPDTVLVASERLVAERPQTVSAAIRAMVRAEAHIHADLAGSIAMAVEHFPGYSPADLATAALRQPPRVDLRDLVATVFGRWDTLTALGLAPGGPPPTAAVQLDLLHAELGAGQPPDVSSAARQGA